MRRAFYRLLVLAALVLVGCPAQPPPASPVAKPPTKQGAKAPVVWRESKSGVGFRLSDADPEPPPRSEVAKTRPLTEEATRKVLARLPRFKKRAQRKRFAMREKSPPAPRPGVTLKTPFPPRVKQARPTGVEADAARALRVTRYAPEGDLETAPNLSVTFSAPMVEVTSHAELAKAKPPVLLTPEPPGQWRWIGTQTVLFEPEERFPRATDYHVRVPSSTRSVHGQQIEAEHTWTFRTPALEVRSFSPSGHRSDIELEPLMFVEFNQRIDRAAVLAHMELFAGTEQRQIRALTEDEIEADRSIRRQAQNAVEDQWLALRAVEPLPKNTRIQIKVKAGTPSAEGPKLTPRDQNHSFRTYGPLRFEHISCHWDDECPPLAPWTLRFNNALDAQAFEKSLITVEPELPGMRVAVEGRHISVRGRSKGRTTYTVRVGANLRDRFGQTLGADAVTQIKVTEAEPMLFPEQNAMVVLDPAFDPKLSVFSVNRRTLRVKLYRVTPEQWDEYLEYRRDWDYDQKLTKPPGRLVQNTLIRPRKTRDELVETQIDLTPALTDGLGQVIAVVESVPQPRKDRWGYARREWVRTWVQVTKLGMQTFWDNTDLYAWVTGLADGSPVPGAAVQILPRTDPAATGSTGIARLELTRLGASVVARSGQDLVFMPGRESWYASTSRFTRSSHSDHLRWLVYDDRGLYKPGEKVHVKGWLRIIGAGKEGDVQNLPRARGRDVEYTVYGARGNKITEGETELDESSGFHLSFQLPKNANLGHASVRLELDDSVDASNHYHSHTFQIQEFRRPEYEVTANVTDGPHTVGTHAIATVRASYYAGGGLADAETHWVVRADDAYFVPPNQSDFHFGKPRRWFWWRSPEEATEPEEWNARTAAGGKHRLRIDFDALDPAYPRNLDLEATVTDVNRQAWTARANILVHPAGVTVGLRQERRFVRAGTNLTLSAIVTDIDGKIVAGRAVTITGARVDWEQTGGETREKLVDEERCELSSEAEPTPCSLPTKQGGQYRIVAEVTDEHGRPSHTRLEVWVLGDDLPRNPNVEPGQVKIIPDREAYAGGQTAELLVMAPFAPAEGVLTLRREGLVELQRFKMEQTTKLLKVHIDPKFVPNLNVNVDLVGSVARENEVGEPDDTLPQRPAFAAGSAELKVPPADRTLSIEVTPHRRKLSPGSRTRIGFRVTDADGSPVQRARLAVVVVDEAVLAVAGYELPDPLAVFYTNRSSDVQDLEMRYRVALSRPDTGRMELQAKTQTLNGHGFGKRNGRPGGAPPMAQKAAPMPMEEAAMDMARPPPSPAPSARPKPAKRAKGGEAEPEAAPLAVRTDFRALAAFRPNVTTDSKGHASVSLKLPDSLTRYRVMVVAASGENHFGTGESAVIARLPLMVRPSPPRFLNYGDKFELPVVLQNQTSKPVKVDVALRADNARLLAPLGQQVTVPGDDRVEIRFRAAAKEPGTARFQIGAVSRVGTDASEHELPVWTPATTEAFATYGYVDQQAVAQRVRAPGGVVTDFGGLEITTSSTALQGLTDAVLYLVRYPFECNEQLSSRVLAIAALRDVLTAFQADGLPSPKKMLEFVSQDVKLLARRQHYSGGWDYWRRDRRPVPYVSIHVTHALVRAKLKGFKVPKNTLDQALYFLKRIQYHIPSHYPDRVRRSLIAYSLYVRHLAEDSDPQRARKLITEAGSLDALGMEAVGWILPVLSPDPDSTEQVAAIRRHLDNRVSETAGRAHFTTSYGEGAHLLLHSDRRADGILLEALILDQPKSDLIPKVVKGLLAHRKRGRWYNTQENAFILLALDRYFNTYEKVTPDFVARAWLGPDLALEHEFRGRSTDRKHVDIPMSYVAKLKESQSLLIAKQGPGRLYYRVGMQYAPSDLRLPAADHGFAVSRVYEGVDSPDHVRLDAKGIWHIKAGALVRVRVNMVARSRRYHVALVDPLPAGLEPLNPALATTGTIPDDPASGSSQTPWWWSRTWYEHQNMRDERVEAFASLLWEGVYDYTYVARATTPGRFVVPPPKAEEMYAPETFGRGHGDIVIVK